MTKRSNTLNIEQSGAAKRWGLIAAALASISLASSTVAPSIAAASSTQNARSAITECRTTQTRSALGSFVTAFNQGDYKRLNALFARPGIFVWYSSNVPGTRSLDAAKNRSTLIPYFRERHANKDRLKLVSFNFNGNTNGYGNFEFGFKRSSADFQNGEQITAHAKGASVCDGANVQFIVMSLGSG